MGKKIVMIPTFSGHRSRGIFWRRQRGLKRSFCKAKCPLGLNDMMLAHGACLLEYSFNRT